MRKSSIVLLGSSLVVVLAVVFFVLNNSATKKVKKNKNELSDWSTSYELDSKNPQDLNLFSQLLTFRSKAEVKSNIELNKILKDQKQTYLFIGQDFALTKDELNQLLQKVRKGNQLIISFDRMNESMQKQFFTETYTDWIYSLDYEINTLDDKNYNFKAVFQMDTIAKRWNLFNQEYFYYDQYEALSGYYESPNFVKFPFGEGEVLLHANPELFMNYQLLQEDGYKHANFFIDQIPEKNEILFLKLAEFKPENVESSGDSNDPNYDSGMEDDSYLRLIFQYKSLFYAFLLSIFGILLYLIFRSKRSLPVVPYIAKPRNSTLAFSETMASIYFQDRKSFDLLLAMRKNFYVQIQKHYQLELMRTDSENRLIQLAEKSNVPLAEIEILLMHLEEENPKKIDAAFLQNAHALQRDFYVKTGIIKPKLIQKSKGKTNTIKRNLKTAFFLIASGLILVLSGFVLLSAAVGIGILLWPIGGFILGYGIFLLNLPLLEFTDIAVVIFDSFNRKERFLFSDLTDISQTNSRFTFTFSGARSFTIDKQHISSYDRTLWEQFIQQIQQK